MASELRCEAFVLQRGKKIPEDQEAWREVKIEQMELKKAQRLQHQAITKPIDIDLHLSKLRCGDARRQIQMLLDARQASEGLSGYIWKIIFVEAHRTSVWVKGAIRDKQVTFTKTIDVVLARSYATPSAFEPFTIPPSGPASYTSSIYRPQAAMPSLSGSKPLVPPATPKKIFPGRAAAAETRRQSGPQKADATSNDSDSETSFETVFDDDSSEEDTIPTMPSSGGRSTDKSTGNGPATGPKKRSDSNNGSPLPPPTRKKDKKPAIVVQCEDDSSQKEIKSLREQLAAMKMQQEEAEKKGKDEKIEDLKKQLAEEKRRNRRVEFDLFSESSRDDPSRHSGSGQKYWI